MKLLEPASLRQCRVLVLSNADVEPVLRALRALPAAHGVLTVSDELTFVNPEIVIALAQRDGRIVFGINPDAAAKAGLEGYARAAAATYAAAGIRINVVAPGLTDTPLAAPLLRSDASRAASEAMHPTGRIGRPEEVAEAAAFLLSPKARSITGIVVPADGGMGRLRPPPRVGPS